MGRVEWRLLFFLLLFMDVKIVIKVAALLMIYILNPGFRFGFKGKNSRLPLFYPIVIGISVINWLLYQNFSLNYTASLFTGILFWIMCILAVHQLKSLVDKTETDTLHNTLILFFKINIAVSLFNLLVIFADIGLQNPFLYQGMYQKYFVNTGDYIKGISFDTSTANALINAFGIIYFLSRKQYAMVFISMAILLLTASNFTNLILLIVFIYLLLFKSSKEQKSIIICCLFMLVIFLAKFSPQNDRYINETFRKFFPHNDEPVVKQLKPVRITDRPDSLLNKDERREKTAQLYMDSLDRVLILQKEKLLQIGRDTSTGTISERPFIETPSIHSAPFQRRNDTTEFQQQLLAFSYANNNDPFESVHKYDKRMPGKLIAFLQLGNFLKEHPFKIVSGDGTGNFSSKLAFKTTGLKIAGSYPQKLVYTSTEFFNNHFAVYASFFTKPAASHSIMNNPASVYGQLLSEYGIIGLSAILFYYVWFFFRHRKKMRYGLPLLLILLAAFFVEYWFEQLSIVVLFELMIFIDIKPQAKTDEQHG